MNQPDFRRRRLARRLRDEENLSWEAVGKNLGVSASTAWCLATGAHDGLRANGRWHQGQLPSTRRELAELHNGLDKHALPHISGLLAP